LGGEPCYELFRYTRTTLAWLTSRRWRHTGAWQQRSARSASLAPAHALEPDQVLEWYRWLKEHRHIQDDSELRAFVLDHTAVGQAAQYYLGVPQSFSYCYRHDLRGDRSRNFGDPAEPNAWIAQVRCRGWSISHFLESDGAGNRMWDPYWPPRGIIEVLSIRGYSL
jgi:hypothetical protein